MLEYLAEGGGLALLDVNPGLLIWTALTFLIVFFVLRAFAWGPIAKALDERAGKIQSDLDRAETIRKETEQKMQDYIAKLDGLREEGQQILTEARQDAERLKEDIFQKAREEADAIKGRGVRDLELARDQALKDIHEQVTTLSVAIAGQILGKTLSPNEHRKLITESLKRMQN